jgi:hypothetical protein
MIVLILLLLQPQRGKMFKKVVLTVIALLTLAITCNDAESVCDIFQGLNGIYCVDHGHLKQIKRGVRRNIPVYIPNDFPAYFEIQLLETSNQVEIFGLAYLRTGRVSVYEYIGVIKLNNGRAVAHKLPRPFIGRLMRHKQYSEIVDFEISEIINFKYEQREVVTEHTLWLMFGIKNEFRIRAVQGPFYRFP